MKIKLLLIAFLIINVLSAHSQIEIVINELSVSQLTYEIRDDVFDEGEGEGPSISLECSIINVGETDLVIYPSKARISIMFNYDGVNYEIPASAMRFADDEKKVIPRKGACDFRLVSRLLLGTPLWSESITDYTITMLELLPTVRVRYKSSYSEHYSSRIKRVKIGK